MIRHSLPFPHTVVPNCVTFRELDNALWCGTDSGYIVNVRLFDSRVNVQSLGFSDPVAVLPASDGLSLYVVEQGGAVLVMSRKSTRRTDAKLVADLEGPIVSADFTSDGSLLLLKAGDTPQLSVFDLAIGIESVLASSLLDPATFVTDTAGKVLVLQGPATARQLVEVDPVTGATEWPVELSTTVTALVAAPPASGARVIFADDIGDLFPVDAAGTIGPAGASLGTSVLGLERWGSLLLAVTPATVEAVEWDLEEGPLKIRLPLGPVFANGYTTAEVDFTPTGLAWEDFSLEIEEGADQGIVSAGLEPPGASGTRRVRVLPGPFPGERNLTAYRLTDRERIGRARFRVTRHWPDDENGPPLAVTGNYRALAHWGGGPVGPENVGNYRAPDVWRVAIVFVETKDRPFQGDLAAARSTWEDRLVGAGTTARRYYEEVSYRNTAAGSSGMLGTTITLAESGLGGVVRVDAGWGDLFENDDTDKVTSNPFGGWMMKVDARSEIAGAYCDMLIDAGTAASLLPQIDAVVFVMQNASEDVVPVGDDRILRAKFCWPEAWQGVNFHWKGPTWTTIDPKPCVFMPTGYPAAMPVPGGGLKSFNNILCHELGHTFGCADLYNRGDYPETVNDRLIDALDLMANDWWAPHFSLANRMRLGWIHPSWIESVNFGLNPSSRTVTLQAVETVDRAGPPPGRRVGIEIRIRPGKNYYFEYRGSQAGQMGDNGLSRYYPTSRMLVGTDVVSDGLEPIARPDIMLLPKDADGDGPVLYTVNTDYAETDTTDPDRQFNFRMIFDQIEPGDPNALRVKVEYVGANRAELQIRSAPGRRPPGPPDWKSPDIDIEGPAGPNVIAKGHNHTIIVKVHNGGTFDANDVRINVFSQAFTATPGGAIEILPPAPPQTIPKQQTREFRLNWYVPEHTYINDVEVEHYCVRVEISRYVDPRDPSHNEVVVYNNSAQSNFDTATAPHASPSDRRVTGVTVANLLPRRATYQLAVDQDGAFYRAYIENAWVRLGVGESRMVGMAYESLAGDPIFGKAFDKNFNTDLHVPPNKLALTSLLAPRGDGRGDSSTIIFGASLEIRAGIRTSIVRLDWLGEVIRGFVVSERVSGPQPVTAGRVNVVLWRRRRPGESWLTTALVGLDGRFETPTPSEVLHMFGSEEVLGEAFYLGSPSWAVCRSGVKRLR